MNNHGIPIIDDSNPFYCPNLLPSESAFQESLLRDRTKLVTLYTGKYSTQLAHLDSDSEDEIGSDWILGDYFTSDRGWLPSPNRSLEDLPPYSSIGSPSNKGLKWNSEGVNDLGYRATLKRKGSDSFSDLRAPPKYARSTQSAHESSFDAEVQRVGLRLVGLGSSPSYNVEVFKDQDALRHSGNDFDFLINQLDSAMPGIRLQGRLKALDPPTPQSIMNFLTENDHISERILDILRESNVEMIAFCPSMFDQNGLNLRGREIYSVFSKPKAFQDLTELSFSGVALHDSDLVHIHHLPSISVLLLNKTGIGNEAVFLLVPLKRTLTWLSLATNPHIDADAVPALLLLFRLSYISILDTGIEMDGLRRIAKTIQEENRVIDVEIPRVCGDYVDSIESQYLCNPQPPLTKNDKICNHLSTAALKRNLEAHAACNLSITASGTRLEMAQRLAQILRIRKLDMLVVDMLEGADYVDKKYGFIG